MSNPKLRSSIRARIIRHLREWHRRLGIWAAFFLIFLSLTGIALNHTNFIGLAHQAITSTWLLDHYGIKNPTDVRSFQQDQIVVTDQVVWLDEKLLIESDAEVIAAGKFQQFLLVLTTDNLSIFTEKGEFVDQLNNSLGLPENITNMAILEQYIVVNTPSGYYQTNADLIEWQAVSMIVEPQWIVAQSMNENKVALASAQYRSQFLTLERVIVDAHSGRLFGDVGVYFMDLVAFCLVLLSASGIYIWVRYSRTKR